MAAGIFGFGKKDPFKSGNGGVMMLERRSGQPHIEVDIDIAHIGAEKMLERQVGVFIVMGHVERYRLMKRAGFAFRRQKKRRFRCPGRWKRSCGGWDFRLYQALDQQGVVEYAGRRGPQR